jgi:hypothetical protein
VGSKYEFFEGGKLVEHRGKSAEEVSETIKQRIDRETKEAIEAGRGKRTIADIPSSAAGYVAEHIMDIHEQASQSSSGKEVLKSGEFDPAEQEHWRHHFEVSVFPKVGAANLDEFLALCLYRDRPVPAARRNDYVWLHRNRQEWLLQFSRAENAAWLRHLGTKFAIVADEGDELTARPLIDEAGEVIGAEVMRDGEPYMLFGTSVGLISDGNAPKPGPWTSKAIADVTGVLGARGHAYTVEDEFENFIEQAKTGEQTLRQAFRGALGQKLTREKSTAARMKQLYDEEHETMEAMSPEQQAEYSRLELQWLDSIRDICGYGLLFFGWAKSQVEES